VTPDASIYSFSDYSPSWPAQFEAEADALRSLLEDNLLAIHHVGSTSVPGLAAKPTIDLLPVVSSLARLEVQTTRLVENGYRAWGEYGLKGRRFFTKDLRLVRTHNIHAYQMDDSEIERHLGFCAYLRAHESVRKEYEALKRTVYQQHPTDIAAYNEGKNAWIKATEQIAIQWYRTRSAA
jgi:GrpB-like predicted nucleotidyltransferase (UPF0157 family)